MNGAYCNMSVPPKTTVRREIRSVGKSVVFGLKLFGPDALPVRLEGREPGPLTDDDYASWLAALGREKGAELAAAPRPAGYAVALKMHQGLFAEGMCRCDSPILTAAVVSRIAGGIYIPRRRPALCRYNAENVFMLQVSAFPQEALELFSPFNTAMGALDAAEAGPGGAEDGVMARMLKKLGGSK